MEPKVTLLSWTENPLATLWTIWESSRRQDSLATILEKGVSPDNDQFFSRIINEDIPVAEMVDFVFVLEGVSVSLREQLVRHRIGVKVGMGIGVDQVPDLADSSFWSQSMRILNMGQFATEGNYHIPDSIAANKLAGPIYRTAMMDAEAAYRSLVGLHIPLEDARQLIPLGATHSIVWKLNLAALKKIVGKRSCWILQLGLWKPLIMGMVNELAEKVNPLFRQLVTPPCYNKEGFKGCHFCENNYERIMGKSDEIPPCPIFILRQDQACDGDAAKNDRWRIVHGTKEIEVSTKDAKSATRFLRMLEEFEKFWGPGFFKFTDTGEDCGRFYFSLWR